MSIKITRLDLLLALAAAMLLTTGCATEPHKVNNGWPQDPFMQTYRAVVHTAPIPGEPSDPASDLARLKAYYQAMQSLVGTNNLEEQFIGCIECARLSSGPQPSRLTFVFHREHKVDLYAFVTALEKVQATSARHAGFRVDFDSPMPQAPVCPAAPPICWPNPSCTSTGGCDANRAQAGCQPC